MMKNERAEETEEIEWSFLCCPGHLGTMISLSFCSLADLPRPESQPPVYPHSPATSRSTERALGSLIKIVEVKMTKQHLFNVIKVCHVISPWEVLVYLADLNFPSMFQHPNWILILEGCLWKDLGKLRGRDDWRANLWLEGPLAKKGPEMVTK